MGTIINELGHQGQINGAIVQGVGYALMEELLVEDGRVTTPNFADYKIPTVQDIPELITVNVPDYGDALGPFHAKSIGEIPTIPTAGAIANAVADAIGAPVVELPLTAETSAPGALSEGRKLRERRGIVHLPVMGSPPHSEGIRAKNIRCASGRSPPMEHSGGDTSQV